MNTTTAMIIGRTPTVAPMMAPVDGKEEEEPLGVMVGPCANFEAAFLLSPEIGVESARPLELEVTMELLFMPVDTILVGLEGELVGF